MNTRPTTPPFPASIDALLAPGAAAALSTLELGAAFRLLQAAWGNGCLLPADEAAVASLAGLTAAEWQRCRGRLVWALAIEWDGERSGATCTRAAAVLEALGREAARAASLSEVRAQAGRAGAMRRWGADPQPTARDGKPMAIAMRLPSGGARASASALERSAQNELEQERSSAGPSGVVGVIHAAIDATATARLTAWRVAMSLEMLRDAARRWNDAGLVRNDDDTQAALIRIANDGRVTPALVQIALQRAAAANAANPLGYVIGALGVKRGGVMLQPYFHDQGILDRWARLEARQVDVEKAKAAVAGVVSRAVPAAQPVKKTGGGA